MAYSRLQACINFVKNHNPHVWQWRIARDYALGTAIVLPLAAFVLCIALVLYDSAYASRTLPFYATAAVLGEFLYMAVQRGIKKFVGHQLILLYSLLAFAVAWSVGIGVGSVLLGSVAVLLSGTVCGYWCALLVAKFNTVLLLVIRTGELQGWVQPAYVMSDKPTNFHQVILISLLFHVLAAIGGALYRLEETRRKLRSTEQDFVRRQSTLTATIKQQNQKLRSAEVEKLQQLYRFAEVGELSTALMHDLANSLTTLAFEIDDINMGDDSAITRARGQLRKINDILLVTRRQLKGQLGPEKFDIALETDRAVKLLRPVAAKRRIKLEWKKPTGRFMCFGEKIVFQQQMANLISNAMDSYDESSAPRRLVVVSLRPRRSSMILTVADYGPGISASDMGNIFKPFYTTKSNGMGMGLYLAKRFIENNLAGKLEVKSSQRGTAFTVTLPTAKPPPKKRSDHSAAS